MGAFGQTEGMPSFVLGGICLRGGATQESYGVSHLLHFFLLVFSIWQAHVWCTSQKTQFRRNEIPQ